MVKCKHCGEDAKILFDGRCAGCMSVDSMEVGQAAIDFIYELMGTPLKDGELLQIFKDGQITSGDKPKDSKDAVKNIITNISKNSNSKDAALYDTPIGLLYHKYMYEIDNGKYKIDLLKNYGVTGGGQVVETKAGVVVYKDIEYYDDDAVEDDIDTDDYDSE